MGVDSVHGTQALAADEHPYAWTLVPRQTTETSSQNAQNDQACDRPCGEKLSGGGHVAIEWPRDSPRHVFRTGTGTRAVTGGVHAR